MKDLFPDTMPSKKEQLLKYIKSIYYAPTSSIIKWGCENFSNRSERTARELAGEGKIRRMSDDEKIKSRFSNKKEDIWVFCHE